MQSISEDVKLLMCNTDHYVIILLQQKLEGIYHHSRSNENENIKFSAHDACQE